VTSGSPGTCGRLLDGLIIGHIELNETGVGFVLSQQSLGFSAARFVPRAEQDGHVQRG